MSSSESDNEKSPLQKLEDQVEDATMFFTMMCAVSYVFSLTVVCSYFTSNNDAFTG